MPAAFTPEELHLATGGRFLGTPAAVCGVFTDTRAPEWGGLFVALRGERFDGHDHLAAAAGAGAAVLMMEECEAERFSLAWNVPALLVADTLKAYQALAMFHRRRFDVQLIALTGSVGKTSVKEMLHAIAAEAVGPDAVLATEGNTNNQVGVPQNLLRLEARHKLIVLEMGTSSPGEIEPLSRLAMPDVALVNTVAPCHLEKLGSLAGVAREKAMVYAGLRPGGTAIFPPDAPEAGILRAAATGHTQRTFGVADCDFRATDYHGTTEEAQFTLHFPDGSAFPIRWTLAGEHQARNAAAAAAAAYSLGIAPETIVAGLAKTTIPGMRMQRTIRNGATYWNDAYNASPESMKAVLRQMTSTVPQERLVLVLGDMLELGADEISLHAGVLAALRAWAPRARLLLVGERMRRALEQTPFPGVVRTVGTSRFAAPELADLVRPGDTVLLKASRGTRLERALFPERTKFLQSPEFLALLEPLTLDRVSGDAFPVWEVTEDSRRACENAIFVAIPGAKADGMHYVENALDNGAKLVVARELPAKRRPGVGYLAVSDPYYALALLQQAFYNFPDRRLRLHAVTGTNGKTTTAFLLGSLLPNAGLLSTVEYRIGRERLDADRTTPPARRFFQLLLAMAEAGCEDVILEASSHALDQHRMGAARMRTAIFTNLTGDHLDYHGDMDTYFAAKARLFTEYLAQDGKAFLNAEDPAGLRLAAPVPEGKCRLFGEGYGLCVEKLDASGCAFTLDGVPYRSTLAGRYNVLNLAGAVLAGAALGFNYAALQSAVADPRVPGRLERIDLPSGAVALIDYAHTDDALCNVLAALRPLCSGKLTVVFGCGGDRDRSKRPRMGRVAASLADCVILTNDNPRSETPETILREIASGAPAFPFILEPDRRRALRIALQGARAGDLVLIAGKGHESTQEISGVFHPFNDRNAVEQLIGEMNI